MFFLCLPLSPDQKHNLIYALQKNDIAVYVVVLELLVNIILLFEY